MGHIRGFVLKLRLFYYASNLVSNLVIMRLILLVWHKSQLRIECGHYPPVFSASVLDMIILLGRDYFLQVTSPTKIYIQHFIFVHLRAGTYHIGHNAYRAGFLLVRNVGIMQTSVYTYLSRTYEYMCIKELLDIIIFIDNYHFGPGTWVIT